MIILEIEPNPNCGPLEMRVFHDLEPPRPVRFVRLERNAASRWFAVTGWDLAHGAVPAAAQRIDDSGDGVAVLIRGGDAGLRLKPAGDASPWNLGAAGQWGEAYLVLSGYEDCREQPPAEGED